MIVYFDKLPKEYIGVHGPYYLAKATEKTGKLEVSQLVQSFENLPKFIKGAEKTLKEQCSEVVFHNGSWTKTTHEIFNQEKAGHE